MWTKTTLGESCKMYQPKTISAKEMVADGEYVVFGANGIIGRYDKYNHAEPQLLVTCRGATCGSVNVSEPNSWITGNAMVIQPDTSKISMRFMEYVCRGGIDLSKAITGAAQPQITRKSLEPIEFSYPPLAEQQRIVAKLDAAFAEIDRAIQIQDSRLQETSNLKATMLVSAMENQSWQKVKLNEVCMLRNGRAYKKPELLDEGKYPVLRVGNFFTSDKWYYSDLELDETKYCDSGDLLYAWSASFGARIWDGGKVIYHYHIWRVDGDNSKIDKKFLFYWFEYDKEKVKAAHGTGTTMIHVSKGSMENRDISLPNLGEQAQIVKRLDISFELLEARIKALLDNKNNLTQLKSAILAQELNPSEAA